MNKRNSPSFAFLLNLLLPGLAHLYWRDYLFGVFIFLIMLIAAVLFFVSFFLSLSFWPKALLLALPILFYLFTFMDLFRVIKTKKRLSARGKRAVIIFLVVGVVYQLASPIAAANFLIRNRPETFVLDNTDLSPLYARGDLLKASRLSYSVNVFFLKKPVLHSLPARYDVVRFVDADGRRRNGLVLGLPADEIAMLSGVLVVNGATDFGTPPGGLTLWGDLPLTYVDDYSILVATLRLGRVDTVHMVALPDVVGKVGKLL
ncbi:MAG: hypothetical protein JSW34_12380 [Candidatus Zixiibacteriota bacterium]|nr:MAG: hypothetical protein JSW34_12380 [candidate division Zixibacteria bacterium]